MRTVLQTKIKENSMIISQFALMAVAVAVIEVSLAIAGFLIGGVHEPGDRESVLVMTIMTFFVVFVTIAIMWSMTRAGV